MSLGSLLFFVFRKWPRRQVLLRCHSLLFGLGLVDEELRDFILRLELLELVLEDRDRQFDVVRRLRGNAVPLLGEHNQALLQVPVQRLEILHQFEGRRIYVCRTNSVVFEEY